MHHYWVKYTAIGRNPETHLDETCLLRATIARDKVIKDVTLLERDLFGKTLIKKAFPAQYLQVDEIYYLGED